MSCTLGCLFGIWLVSICLQMHEEGHNVSNLFYKVMLKSVLKPHSSPLPICSLARICVLSAQITAHLVSLSFAESRCDLHEWLCPSSALVLMHSLHAARPATMCQAEVFS